MEKKQNNKFGSLETFLSTNEFSLILQTTDIGFFGRVASFGINYGQVANNLPPPDKVLELFSNLKVTKTRIYDTNPQILTDLIKFVLELSGMWCFAASRS